MVSFFSGNDITEVSEGKQAWARALGFVSLGAGACILQISLAC
jgi:hypothetical protein